MVGTLHYVEVVLDDDDGMTTADERAEGFQQLLDVVEVLAGGRFVEYEDGRRCLLDAEEVSQLHTLVFTTREGRR